MHNYFTLLLIIGCHYIRKHFVQMCFYAYEKCKIIQILICKIGVRRVWYNIRKQTDLRPVLIDINFIYLLAHTSSSSKGSNFFFWTKTCCMCTFRVQHRSWIMLYLPPHAHGRGTSTTIPQRPRHWLIYTPVDKDTIFYFFYYLTHA